MNNQVFYTLCPRCGKEIRAGVKFCPHCAASFASEISGEMVCPSCGKVAPKGEKFCSDCGHAYAPKQGSAPMQAVHTPVVPRKMAVQVPVNPQATQGTSRLDFFDAHTTKGTKNILMVMPVLCALACIFCIVEMIYSFVMLATYPSVGGVLAAIFFGLIGGVMGVIVYFMVKLKSTAVYIAETIVVAFNLLLSILTSFGVVLILTIVYAVVIVGIGVYCSYRLWKLDNAYNEYLRTGALPQGEI